MIPLSPKGELRMIVREEKEETTIQKDFVERGHHHQALVTMINVVSKELARGRVKKVGGG